ncbi:MAG TPA: endospore germination permease [Bacillota bacterium]|nr:endospore germination permease [Bacillota bacterium]
MSHHDRNSPQLPAGAFFALLAVSALGVDFMVDSYDAAAHCGPSGYLAAGLACVLILPMLSIIFLLRKHFPGANLLDISRQVLGGPLAVAGNLIFLLPFYSWFVLTIRAIGDLLAGYLLEQTPIWVITAAFLPGVIYLAFHGLKAVSRLAAFILIPTVFIRFLLWMLALPNGSIDHLLPVFSNPFMDYLKGGIGLSNVFLPFATIFLIYPLLEEKKDSAQARQTGGLAKPIWGAYGLSSFFFLLAICETIAIFGADTTTKFFVPTMEAIRMINFHYIIIEEAGLLFLIVWLTTYYTSISYYLQTVAHGIGQIFPRIKYNWAVIGLGVVAWICGLFIPNSFIVVNWFIQLRKWVMWPAIIYPFIIYLIAVITGKRGVHR